MNVIDLRMNKLLTSVRLMDEEITSVCSNLAMDSLVVGFKDGNIKIVNCEKNFEARETFNVFPAVGGKKISVTHVNIHEETGGIYASSNTGILKLFRTRI